MNTSAFFHHDKPLFGLDIGYSSIKIMQIEWNNKRPVVTGYGVGDFDPKAIKDGVIVDPEAIARSAQALFGQRVVGEITSRRLAMGIPASRTYGRLIKLPKLATKDLPEAIRTEAEQYIPVPIDSLYMDYVVVSHTDKEMEIFSVAVPKTIIDSYVTLSRLLGLEAVAMETTISAAARLFVQTNKTTEPTVLIDFGSRSSDITIFDKTLIVTGTVPGGGDNITASIADKLHVTPAEAYVIKVKYGLDHSKKQKEIAEALRPTLDQLLKEIRRMIRYYEERYGGEKKISQIVTMGGGANMPGLNEYLTELLRLPVRMSDPWQHIGFSKLEPPSTVERSLYVTVSGLALMSPKEVFA